MKKLFFIVLMLFRIDALRASKMLPLITKFEQDLATLEEKNQATVSALAIKTVEELSLIEQAAFGGLLIAMTVGERKKISWEELTKINCVLFDTQGSDFETVEARVNKVIDSIDLYTELEKILPENFLEVIEDLSTVQVLSVGGVLTMAVLDTVTDIEITE